jgi:carboxymethylenebutenolidase
MCFETDSLPPILRQRLMAAIATPLTLTSADSTPFAAFLARPERPSGAGVIVLPDMRGLHRFYEQLAVCLAEQGHAALAIDYYGRTAGAKSRAEGFPFMEHIFQVTRKTLEDDIAAAISHLRAPDGGDCRTVAALGFCFGGRQAFFASAPRFGLAGVIGIDGAPSFYPNGAPGPTQRAGELAAPILALFAGADEGISSSEVTAFDEALTAARVDHEVVTYPGAPHSFFDIKYKEHAAACADAWQRVLGFIAAHNRPSEPAI